MTADYLLNENPSLRERDELLAHLVDDGTISAEAAAKERRRLRGICSEPDCDQAIDGWCAGCGAKLCETCLSLHEQDGCEDAHAAALWCLENVTCANCGDTTVAVQCDSCREWQCNDCWRYGRNSARLCPSCAAANSEQRSGGDGA